MSSPSASAAAAALAWLSRQRRGERAGRGSARARPAARPVERLTRRRTARGGLHAAMLGHSADSSHHQLGWPPSASSSSTPSGTSASTPSSSSGAPSPAMHGHQLGVRRQPVEHAPQRRARARPRRRSPRRRSRPRRRPRSGPGRPSRAAGATPPVRSRASASSIAAAFSAAPRLGDERDGRDEPGLLRARRHDADDLLGQLGGALGRHDDVRLLGSTTTSSAGTAWMPASDLVGRRVQRRAAVEHVAAERAEQSPPCRRRRRPPARRSTARALAAARAAAEPPVRALGDLLVHVGDVEPRDLAGAVEERRRPLGLVGVDVDLQRPCVADDEDRVAERLERVDDEPASRAPVAGRPRSSCSSGTSRTRARGG